MAAVTEPTEATMRQWSCLVDTAVPDRPAEGFNRLARSAEKEAAVPSRAATVPTGSSTCTTAMAAAGAGHAQWSSSTP